MARTTKIQAKITKYLKEEKQEATFHEILRHINDSTRHGTTSQQLSNILSKNPHKFKKLGMTNVMSVIKSDYMITIWGLSETQEN